MTHEEVIETVKSMPVGFKMDELVDRLLVLEKIEEAEQDVAEGRVIPHSDMEKLFEQWKK